MSLGLTQAIFSLLEQRDIDTVLNEYMQYMNFEFMGNIPVNMLANSRTFIKHIKDFYLSRGSEGSYKLLFQVLFNDSVSFYYPKYDLFSISNSTWTSDTVIRTTTTNNTLSFIGQKIIGKISKATANVENVVQIPIGNTIVSEIYISNLSGSFLVDELISVTISNNIFYETVYGLAIGIDIINPGTGYQPGNIISIFGNNQTALFVVNTVIGTEIGFSNKAQYENYPQPPNITLENTASNIDNFYQNMYLTIIGGTGSGQIKQIVSYNGLNKVAILNTNWLVLPDNTSQYSISYGQIESLSPINFGYNYLLEVPANFSLSGNRNATGNIVIGAVGNYPGRYINNKGLLGEKTNVIQDSYFYQTFSYQLKSHESLSQYSKTIKNVLHPAGLKMFGNVSIGGISFTRKNANLNGILSKNTFTGILPATGLVAQYACIENDSYPTILYDDSGAYPNGYNCLLNASYLPIWNGNAGLYFNNAFVQPDNPTYSKVPVNNSSQTIIVVYKVNSLAKNNSMLGSIDTNNDSGISGYQFINGTDGSLTFRTQKMNPNQNNLEVSYPPGSINTSNYYFASLRYSNNTLIGNLGQLAPVSASFGSNIDNIGVSIIINPVISNSSGYYFGIGGYVPSFPTQYKYGMYGTTMLSTPFPLVSFPENQVNDPFDGYISYIVIYNSFLMDQEISNVYQYLKNYVMDGRGIEI
jgi:hypothetical protein